MFTAVMRTSRLTAKWLLVASALTLVGLLVGVTCVLLPAAVPAGIIGVVSLLLLFVMPDLAGLPTGVARALIIPVVFSLISIPQYYAIVFHNAPWISMRRLIIFPFIGMVIISLAGSALNRKNLVSRLKDSRWLSFFTIGYFIIQVIAALMSTKPASSASELINMALNLYIPMIAVVVLIKNIEDVSKIALAMLFAMFIDFLIGGVEFYLKHVYLYHALPGWIITEIVTQNPLAPVVPFTQNGSYRATSTYMVALSWAEFAMMMTPIALHFFISARLKTERIVGITALLAIMASLAMSGSRGGYVGFLADGGLFMFIYTVRQIVTNPKSLYGPISSVFFAMSSTALAAAVLFIPNIRIRVLGGGARAASDQGRHEQWALAMPKFYSRPIFGYGPGTAADTVGWMSPSGFTSLDSYIINVMMSSGLLGLAFFFSMFLMPVIYCFNKYSNISAYDFSLRASLACSLFGYAVYRTSLNQTENNSLAFIIVGLIIVVNHLTKLKPHSA